MQNDKENKNKVQHGQTKIPVYKSGKRAPLATLQDEKCEAKVVENEKVSTSTIVTKKVVRSKSAGRIEIKTEIKSKTTKITQKPNAADAESKQETEIEYFNYQESSTKTTNLTENLKKIQKPRKRTLLKRPTRNDDDLYSDPLYSDEYFTDNWIHMIVAQKRFIFEKKSLIKHSDCNARMAIVSWLSSIQQVLKLSDSTFFVAVRMLDNMLVKAQFSSDDYLFLGITCLWIAGKLHDKQFIPVTKITQICSEQFTKNDIFSMEKAILKHLDFDVNYPDPVSFLFFLLKHMELENSVLIRLMSMFLLEMFTLLYEFSSSSTSVLAASALYLALNHYKVASEALLDYVEIWVQEKNKFTTFAKKLKNFVDIVLQKKSFENQIVTKYSAADNYRVARCFKDDI